MSSHHDHQKGLLITAIGGLTLTVDIPLIRLADGGPWTIMMLRTGTTLVAALVIWAVWRALRGNVPQLIPGWSGLAVALCYGLTGVTFVTAVYHTSTADLVFILAFNTVFAALLSWLFLRERPQLGTVIAMLAMILGVLIIVGGSVGTGHLFGDFMALCSALFVAIAITISRASGKDMGFTALVGVALPLAVALFMVSGEGFHVNAPWWIILN
ncbi:DMT family transporter, partial [Mesorhizobium sp. USDA-HM6]